MMSKKSPQLRFKGFTDDWEDRKLKDILREFSTKSKIENEYRVLSSTNVGMEFRDGRVSGTSNLGYKIIKNGDLVLSPQNLWLGNININNIGTGLVSPSYKTFNFTDIDSSFIKPQLRTPKMLEEYKNSSTQGASVVRRNLEIDSFYQIKIATPSIKEQEKIGSFFKHLDALITLQQRKLDLLKEQKKGYLQKMFPKNGAKVPELRFAGFADDWELRKLKDVTERVRSNDGRMDLPTLTMSASSGWLDQKDRFSGDISGKEKKNYTLLKKGELSYNHGNSKLAKYGVVFSLTNYEEALVPRVYHSFKALENTSADFIEYMFSTKLPDRELGKLVSSGARMDGLLNINYDDFMNIHISIPNYEEQILMSSFFRKLDETIALHQRKLDLLKEQKKGFLQKMFV
ncbi:restriction endonuclease subunit S [Lactococcus lactis]|uniref:restriction endonuclease subunit S n=1 Tax=Lactococcus lactis TaxID=1358 RepID=UPI0026584399|nr:restriction endonuclease subunit S [Lactococcus lactis]WKG36260.1 restriction endonuclease subunit S [Lactococcus lactis subsp. lactis]